MVIQRWQSVWLLVAAILVALFCFLPMAYLNIFSFKDTRRQKMMTIVAVVMIAVLAACAVLMVYGFQTADGRAEWMGSILLLAGAVIFALLAYRGISHDEKLLKGADRLR